MSAAMLCATDLTNSAERTVDLAIFAAQAFGVRVHLLHVVDNVDALLPSSNSDQLASVRDKLREAIAAQESVIGTRLEEQVARCRAAGVDCNAELTHGRAWRRIHEVAEEQDAFLVVIGDHGASPQAVEREGWTERMIGSTTDRVIRAASRPVFVATGKEAIPAGLRDCSWFVGTDYSESAAAAVSWAKRAVGRVGGKLHIANVIMPAGGEEKPDEERSWRQVLRDQSKLEAHSRLEAYVEEHVPGAEAHQVLSPEHPARALCEAAQFADADVIVVGTHSQSVFGRMLIGSTAERCLRVASVPILLVPG